jgi:formylglycine-generating enzyme
MIRGRVVYQVQFAALASCLGIAISASAAPLQYTITDLGALEGGFSRGLGINASGHVTGHFSTADAEIHAFAYDGIKHDLGTLGGTFSSGYGINASGHVTGQSSMSGDAEFHAYLHDGTMHDLGTLGGSLSFGWDINQNSHVTGWSDTVQNSKHAFLYDGTMHDLGTLGGTESMGFAINSGGQVTGFAHLDGDTAGHAFLYDGTMHDLGTLGGTFSSGYGINASGHVTGVSAIAGIYPSHAFLYDGTMHDLGTLGGVSSEGWDINAHGYVVGQSATVADTEVRPFLYNHEFGMIDLNLLIDPLSGWQLREAHAINDAGQIVGFGFHDGKGHAYLLTPVPEPTTLSLMGIGFLIVTLGRRRNRPFDVLAFTSVRPITKPKVAVSVGLGIAIAFIAADALAVTIDTVPVGNAGNAPDQNYNDLGQYGAVDHAYRIGKYEVTNSQYAEFLNAKAKSDPFELYNTSMGSNLLGGISRTGPSGNFSYEPRTNMGNKPVNYVSFYDAIRFANWLNNGQGSADTESGAYTLADGTSVVRNSGATWFLPSDDQWYKAAYYDPRGEAAGGPLGDDNYWYYPTMSDSLPTSATANSIGDISNPGVNVANYNNGAVWNGTDFHGNVTTVGSAEPSSNSFYGTADQGGNVFEWNDQSFAAGDNRGLMGGSWPSTGFELSASANAYGHGWHTEENWTVGFRVATVPEPGTAVLATLAFGVLLWWRSSRVRHNLGQEVSRCMPSGH